MSGCELFLSDAGLLDAEAYDKYQREEEPDVDQKTVTRTTPTAGPSTAIQVPQLLPKLAERECEIEVTAVKEQIWCLRQEAQEEDVSAAAVTREVATASSIDIHDLRRTNRRRHRPLLDPSLTTAHTRSQPSRSRSPSPPSSRPIPSPSSQRRRVCTVH
ncbi:zinc finger family protein [Striga asiatica]|uniref:Zinc finger family protein n=1 Tax=Striga asiatica TaxID=4170 RepID=A0A5A7Q7V0_STRAF|nr:zinc finger family protein [Striga asiatica]